MRHCPATDKNLCRPPGRFRRSDIPGEKDLRRLQQLSVQPSGGSGDRRLAAGEQFGFAVGDFGFNLYWQGLGLFLIYFQTDVLGIPPGWAGLCYLLASIWDGLCDPMMGLLADRTRSRWGRFRPYLLFGSVPLAFGFTLAFSAPPLPLPLLIAYTLAAQLLVRTLYNALAIPYSSLSAAITRNSDERTALSGLRMQCAFAGGVAAAYLVPATAAHLTSAYGRNAYGIAAALIGVAATITFLWCFAAVRERDDGFGRVAAPRGPLWPEIRAFLAVTGRSQPLLRLLAARFVISLTLTMHTRNTVYFFKYVLGAEGLVPLALPLFAAISVISAPLWVRVIRRRSKLWAWQLGCLLSAACALSLHLPAALNPGCAVVLLGVFAFSTTAYAVCFWAMLPDTVEYNEWRFGRRDEAKVFGIASLTLKIGMGISAMAAGLLFDAAGFAANQAQNPATLQAIRTTMGLIPACGMLVSMLLMRGYILDEDTHHRIVRALDAGSDSATTPAGNRSR